MKRARLAARVVLLAGGLALAALLVRAVGTAAVLDAFRRAGPFLPVIAAFELAVAATDTFAARAFAGPAAREVPVATWLRATLIVYASTILLPAGRAAGEAGRAAAIAPYIGVGRAAGVATRVQSGALIGNGVICVAAAFAAALVEGRGAPLVAALGVTAVVCLAGGVGTWVLARSVRFGAWLRARAARFVKLAPPRVASAPTSSREEALGLALGVVARVLQTVQYGLVLAALTGGATLLRGLVAQGIHLVGAAAGDMIPSQMGAMEGAYYYFAPAIGLADDRARAVSLALVVRVAQIATAATCVVAAVLSAPRASAAGADVARPRRSGAVEPPPDAATPDPGASEHGAGSGAAE